MKNIINRIRDSYWRGFIRKNNRKLSTKISSLKNRTKIVLENDVQLGNVEVRASNVFIGAGTYIRSGSVLSIVSSIGRYCSIGSNCYIGQEKHTHPTDWISTHPFQYEAGNLEHEPVLAGVNVGHDVWIGHGAMILEGVQVGTGAVIAVNALVTRDVPPYAVVAGNPAKIVKYRHSVEIIERLLKSSWWERDINWLKSLPLNSPHECLPFLEAESIDQKHSAYFNKMEISNKTCKIHL